MFFKKDGEMLTDGTGKKRQRAAGEALNSHCVFPSQMSHLFCLCGGKTVFVAWQHVFCVLFEGEACHNKKGYQPLKDTATPRTWQQVIKYLVIPSNTYRLIIKRFYLNRIKSNIKEIQ